MRPYISIVVPVYNSAPNLRCCMESVLGQTLREIEVICVDDGSLDGSLALLKEYEKVDDRLRIIIHEDNKGTLTARKDGVLNALGQYVMFVDPDDFIEKNACEVLYNKLKETGADIIGFGMFIEAEEPATYPGTERYFCRNSPCLLEREIVRGCFVDPGCSHNLCNKIFEAELCKKAHLELPDRYCVVGEDACAFFVIACKAQKFIGIAEKLYHYRVGLGITKETAPNLKWFQAYSRQSTAVEIVREALEKNGEFSEYEKEFWAFEERLFHTVLFAYLRLPSREKERGRQIMAGHWGDERVRRGLNALLDDDATQFKDVVLYQFAAGRIGFRYIARYFKAWLKAKLKKEPA